MTTVNRGIANYSDARDVISIRWCSTNAVWRLMVNVAAMTHKRQHMARAKKKIFISCIGRRAAAISLSTPGIACAAPYVEHRKQ